MSTTRKVLEAKLSDNNFDWIIAIEFHHYPGWLRRTFLRTKESWNVISYIGSGTCWAHYPSFITIHNNNMQWFLHSVWSKADYEHKIGKIR